MTGSIRGRDGLLFERKGWEREDLSRTVKISRNLTISPRKGGDDHDKEQMGHLDKGALETRNSTTPEYPGNLVNEEGRGNEKISKRKPLPPGKLIALSC